MIDDLYPTGAGGYKAKSFDEPGVIYQADCDCLADGEENCTYTRENFIAIANGYVAYAHSLFERVTWQHPETLVDEDKEDED